MIATRDTDRRSRWTSGAGVGGVVLATVAAVVLPLVTSVPVLLGVAVGLLVVVLGLLLELRTRVAAEADHKREAKGQLCALLDAVERVPWLLKYMSDTASCAVDAIAKRDRLADLFVTLTKAQLERTRILVQQLNDGYAQVPPGDVDPMSEHLKQTRFSIRATTIASLDNDWWLSRASQDYLEQTRLAIQRGVVAERVILWKPADVTADLARMVANQHKAGMTLLFARTSDLARDEQLESVVILDEDLSSRVAYDVQGRGEAYFYYFRGRPEIAAAVARFDRIKAHATSELPPSLAELLSTLPSS